MKINRTRLKESNNAFSYNESLKEDFEDYEDRLFYRKSDRLENSVEKRFPGWKIFVEGSWQCGIGSDFIYIYPPDDIKLEDDPLSIYLDGSFLDISNKEILKLIAQEIKPVIQANESLNESTWNDEKGDAQPSTVKYKGFKIKPSGSAQHLNIYDSHNELVDSGFKTLAAAKKFCDENKDIVESFKRKLRKKFKETLDNGKIDSREDDILDKVFAYLRQEKGDEEFVEFAKKTLGLTDSELKTFCGLCEGYMKPVNFIIWYILDGEEDYMIISALNKDDAVDKFSVNLDPSLITDVHEVKDDDYHAESLNEDSIDDDFLTEGFLHIVKE